MNNIPLSHPDRTPFKFQPLKAWGHFRKLIANKEDTEQVFHIIRSLSGKGFSKRASAFWNSEAGQKMMADRQGLVAMLDDHDSLRKLPVGSVGQAYCDFMETEGLSAQGLVDEYDKFSDNTEKHHDLIELYGNRQRDTHDLHHILTGYGRDALGEASVLAFSYAQNPNLGVLFIAYAAGLEMKKNMKNVPFFTALNQARRNGKAAQKIVHQDIRALLAEPLVDARKRLGISEPTAYVRAHDVMKVRGVDPYDMIGKNAATAGAMA